ncbi:hypothetical protein KKF84_16030 [Myxococcota bacterium]|nr:hypothetical protein [Myxococcota bacterium]MBU1536835.1 hypothetical protein [Myxococcota bacterium]
MRMTLLLLSTLLVALATSGCYEKRVCCPVDGGCQETDAGTDAADDADALTDTDAAVK